MKIQITSSELKRVYADLSIESSVLADQFLVMLKGMKKGFFAEILVRETTFNRDELVLKVNYLIDESEDEFRIEGITLKQFFDLLQ